MKDIGLGWRIRVKIDSYLEKLENDLGGYKLKIT
jgi:hypothetical protein